MDIKRVQHENYNLNMLKTNKFKTTRIQIAFGNDLSQDTVTKRALLPYLIKSISAKYNTRSKMAAHLEEMYAASFSVGIKKTGLSQILIFSLSIINNKFTLNDEDLFKEGLDFLKEVLLFPKFDQEIFLQERRLLEEYYKGVYANKLRYSIKKMFEELYKGENYNIPYLGDEEEIKTISLSEVESAYNDMINNDLININVVGDLAFNKIEADIKTVFPFKNRSKELVLLDLTEKPKREAKEIHEAQSVQQAKFAIGYHLPVYYTTDDYYKAIVFNTLVGAGTESLLFKKIREELSLVYFIGSSYDNHKGSFMIYSGINQDEFTKVKNEIDIILTNVKDSNYSDKSLSIAKKTIINGAIEALDSNGSLIARILNLSLFDKEPDIDKLIEEINKVSKEDVAYIANKLTLDTTFFLRNDQYE